MLTLEITFQTLINAVKYQWKFWLAIILAFVLLGVVSGWYYGNRDAMPGDGMAEPLDAVDIPTYDGTDLQKYGQETLKALQTGYDRLKEYIKVLDKEVSLRQKDRLVVEDLQSRAVVYDKEHLVAIRDLLNTTEELGESRALLLEKINLAETALNQLAEELSEAADDIAAQIHINLYLDYKRHVAIIIHGHRENTSAEIFQILTIFCTLVGICAGGFLAVCREAAREKIEKRTANLHF